MHGYRCRYGRSAQQRRVRVTVPSEKQKYGALKMTCAIKKDCRSHLKLSGVYLKMFSCVHLKLSCVLQKVFW